MCFFSFINCFVFSLLGETSLLSRVFGAFVCSLESTPAFDLIDSVIESRFLFLFPPPAPLVAVLFTLRELDFSSNFPFSKTAFFGVLFQKENKDVQVVDVRALFTRRFNRTGSTNSTGFASGTCFPPFSAAEALDFPSGDASVFLLIASADSPAFLSRDFLSIITTSSALSLLASEDSTTFLCRGFFSVS